MHFKAQWLFLTVLYDIFQIITFLQYDKDDEFFDNFIHTITSKYLLYIIKTILIPWRLSMIYYLWSNPGHSFKFNVIRKGKKWWVKSGLHLELEPWQTFQWCQKFKCFELRICMQFQRICLVFADFFVQIKSNPVQKKLDIFKC